MSAARVLDGVKASVTGITLAALAFGACGLDPEGGLLSTEAKELVFDQEDSEAVLHIGTAVAAAPAYVLSLQTVTVASAVAAQENLAAPAQPAGCLTTETAGNRVTYTMNGCTGPWGRHEVSGKQITTFSPAVEAGSFILDIETEDLTIDGAPASFLVRANVSLEADTRTFAWAGSFSGRAEDGREVEHVVDLTLVLPADGTAALSGSTSTRIGLRNVEVEIDKLRRNGPLGTCLEGTVTLRRRLGTFTVTLTFDGSREYVAKTSRGGRGTFEASCTPAEGG